MDTGATINIMSVEAYETLKQAPPLNAATIKVIAYDQDNR